MKAFIKNWMSIFALVVISAFVIPAIFNGVWQDALFIVKLLIATLTICLLQLFTNKIPIQTPLVKYLIELVMALSSVLFFGWIWKWYTLKGIWIMFAMVIPVFIAAILLDLVSVRRDVDIINQQIKLRHQQQEETNHDS